MKKILKNFFYRNKIQYHFLLSFLNNSKLYLADVGATGGVSSNWDAINELMFYYTFDPDPRAKNKFVNNSLNFKSGLWSRKKKAILYQTKFPDASSIYEPNESFLKYFKNHIDHKILDRIKINLTTLDEILHNYTKPDFIKIDAEGADFDILKGSTKILSDSCIGVQCETQFSERNVGSPFFSDIDKFLRRKGFILFDINLERWFRKEYFYSLDSKVQCIWGDSIFIIGIDEIVKRVNDFNKVNKKIYLSKLILICISMKIYDYPVDVIKVFEEKKWITKDESSKLILGIKKNIISTYKIIMIEILFVFFNLFIFIFSFFYVPSINNSYKRFKRSLSNLLILISKLINAY